MLISLNWLERHVDLEGIDVDELARRFTLNVAELEEVHHVGRAAAATVVGHVLEAAPVEGTHLHHCRVDTGAHGLRQIVCGAPNIAAGQRVPVALPGQTIGDLTLDEREVRGLLSQGMICSEAELDLSGDHEGILVLDGEPAPGTPLSEVFPVEDTLLEIDNKSLTHRPDLWGHRGIAREVAAILGRPLRDLDLHVDFTADRPLEIRVEAPVACPRYTAIALDGVTVRPSPRWLRVLLHRVGTRAINNVVDATNFVMLDLGNPLHAFDRREVHEDAIVVRHAQAGETFTTLDGVVRPLDPRDLVIADGARAVALAGVMGGENSEIRDDTSQMILESANFDASTIRMTSVRLGLRTESSARFEKSLDPHLAEDAARSFCRLLRELDPEVCVTSAFLDACEPIPAPPVVDLSVDYVCRKLGVQLSAERVCDMLRRLEFGVADRGAGQLAVTVPSFRATKDVGIAADLVEEVGRSFGYDHVPPQPPTVTLSRPHANHQKALERAARTYLTRAAGLDEVLTYSFAFEPLLERIGAAPARPVRIDNPISAEMPYLRAHLGPNLLGVLERNARRVDDLRVFELGRVFAPAGPDDEVPVQPKILGALLAHTELGADEQASLFFGLGGVIGGLARAIGRPALRVTQGGVDHPWAHPARQATLWLGDHAIGYLCEVHPVTLKALDVVHRAALFELDLDAWRAAAPSPVAYQPIARYPSVFRDFAVVVPEAVRAGDVQDAIAGADPALIRSVTFQSAYRGAGLDGGHKSLAWSVTMAREDRTLTDPEVRTVEDAVWAALADRVGGVRRA